jgi:hypothetical protein
MTKFILCIIIIFSFLPFDAAAQKSKTTAKPATTNKSTGTKKTITAPPKQLSQNTSASTEVLAFIPKKDFYNLEKVIDISVLENLPAGTGVLYEYHGPQSIDCHKKLDAEAAKKLLEVRKKQDGLDYTLVVDWVECKIISVEPYSTKPRNDKSHWTVYQISLNNGKSEEKTKTSTAATNTTGTAGNSSIQRPLLFTYQNSHGEHIASGPYGASQPYNTEKEALEELFYADPGALSYLCTRGIYKIYVINTKDDSPVRYQIRDVLKTLGYNDIPN